MGSCGGMREQEGVSHGLSTGLQERMSRRLQHRNTLSDDWRDEL